MKKFIISALCAAVVFCAIPFAACSSESSGLINLADCEIGYELPVYPDCEFDYKVDDNCTVHISEIKAVLTAKNEINEGDVIEGYYYRYEIEIQANGQFKGEYTSQIGTQRSLLISSGLHGSMIACSKGTVQEDGAIAYSGTLTTNYTQISIITFVTF